MEIPVLENSPDEIVRALSERVRRIEGVRRHSRARPITTGCPALDRILPGGGFTRGTLVEWFAADSGSGTWTLSILAAREALADGGALVVMDRKRCFYPPAAAALGIDMSRLVLVRAANEKDELWALDQALRCEGVAVAWAPLENVPGRTFRRFQLAAESSGSLGMLLRPGSARGRPTWADVQLAVYPRPSLSGRRLRVELVRCRFGASGRAVELEIDQRTGKVSEVSKTDETHSVHLPAPLADSAASRRSAGA